jgi:hypothetical protein
MTRTKGQDRMEVATFAIALCAASLMGFASQRSGTCAVAAIREIATKRRFGRLIALLDGMLWAGCGFIVLNAVHLLQTTPPDFVVGLATIAGGIVFGLGALLNRSCLLGTVARLGSGEWAYAATPIGIFIGSLASGGSCFAEKTHETTLVLTAPALGAAVVPVFVAVRLYTHWTESRRQGRSMLDHLWSPHIATIIIAIAFFVAFATAGNWHYAQLLRDLARGNSAGVVTRSLLALALLAGAIVGGWKAHLLKPIFPNPVTLLRCLAGGSLMGFGACLIPGGNTTLLFLGMPLLWPFAWLGFATICITIYSAIELTRHRPPPPRPQ